MFCLFCGKDGIDKSQTTDIIFNNDLQNYLTMMYTTVNY